MIDTLELLVLLLDPHADADLEDDDDYVSALTSIRTSSETARGVFADFEDDDDAPTGTTPVPGGVVGDDGDDDDDPTPVATTPATASPTETPEPEDTPDAEDTPESGETPEPEDTPEAGETPEPDDTATPEPTASSTPDPTASATATADPTAEPPGESTSAIPATAGSYQASARGAGTVSYSYAGQTLTVTDVSAADGWSADIEESTGSEIRVEFSRGLERVELEVERQDAELRIIVRWWTVVGNG